MLKPNYILLKDLPGCPAGRIFKPTNDGKHYFLSLTDYEYMDEKFHPYKYKTSEVVNNTGWFKVEEVSDLKCQLESARKQKQDAENKIADLKKVLMNDHAILVKDKINK